MKGYLHECIPNTHLRVHTVYYVCILLTVITIYYTPSSLYYVVNTIGTRPIGTFYTIILLYFVNTIGTRTL